MIDQEIARALAPLKDLALTQEAVRTHIAPLFSRVLLRKEIYLANHSLGRPLDRVAIDVQRALDAWYTHMDGAWEHWSHLQDDFRARIAALIGAPRPDCVVPKMSAGQGLRSVINALPVESPRIIATSGEFDSLDFILRTYRARNRASVTFIPPKLTSPGKPSLFDTQDIIRAIDSGEAPHLVVVPQVFFSTGQVLDSLPQLVSHAQSRGSLVLIDAYHSAGVIDVDMTSLGADFMIGGSYKYTRGGPGACWLSIHPRHLSTGHAPALRTLDTGWFAKKDTFKYERTEEPLLKPGGDAWLESTPAILPFAQARSGLHFTLGVGVSRLRAYSLQQLTHLNDALQHRGVQATTPTSHGAFLLLWAGEKSHAACDLLRARGVAVDARSGWVRLCPDILTTAAELDQAAEIISACWRELELH